MGNSRQSDNCLEAFLCRRQYPFQIQPLWVISTGAKCRRKLGILHPRSECQSDSNTKGLSEREECWVIPNCCCDFKLITKYPWKLMRSHKAAVTGKIRFVLKWRRQTPILTLFINIINVLFIICIIHDYLYDDILFVKLKCSWTCQALGLECFFSYTSVSSGDPGTSSGGKNQFNDENWGLTLPNKKVLPYLESRLPAVFTQWCEKVFVTCFRISKIINQLFKSHKYYTNTVMFFSLWQQEKCSRFS